jgi:hypothetical protein
MRVTPEGDVVTAGAVLLAGFSTFDVARLAGRSGRFVWRRSLHGGSDDPNHTGTDAALAMSLDPRGDVVAAGTLKASAAPQYHSLADFAVVKLDGKTGRDVWRYQRDGAQHDSDAATHVGVDAAGDVLAAGWMADLPFPAFRQPLVVKLAGSDGGELWRAPIDTIDVRGFSVDAADNALIAGTIADPVTANAFGVTKMSGRTGETLWTRRISTPVRTWQTAFQVQPLANGDAAAVGFIGDLEDAPSLLVVVFDGATGAERWRWTTQGGDGYGVGAALTVTPSEVLVVGRVRNAVTCYDILVVRLDAGTGRLLGRRTLDGRATATQCDADPCPFPRCGHPPRHGIDQDAPIDVLLDPRGRVIVAGELSDLSPSGRPVSRAIVRTFPTVEAIAEP